MNSLNNQLAQASKIATDTTLEGLIDAAQAVSFDVFDTLFVRTVLDPEDAFDLIGQKFGILDFRRRRKEAQAEAFQRMQRAGEGEITLDGIYDCVEGLRKGISSKQLRDAEYGLELILTVPNPGMLDIFLETLKTKTVAVVTDMYLPRDFFEALFEKHELPRVPMFVSAERGATKRDRGELFDLMLDELAVAPKDVLHIGDNLVSDVERAQERGLRAYHYVNPLAPSSFDSRSIAASIALSLAKVNADSTGQRSFYDLGFTYGGPAAVGLLEWVRDRAMDDRVDVVLFVSRDGYVLEQLATRGDVSGLPRFAYFPGSRVAFAMAAMDESSFEGQLDFLLAGAHGLSPAEVLERIGVQPPAEKLMRDIGLGSDAVVADANMAQVRSFLYAYRAEILKICRRNRRGLFKLLSELDVRPGSHVALVDVGWNGTTQEMFETALNKLFDVRVSGYYLGLTDSPECVRRRSIMNMQAVFDGSTVDKLLLAKLYEKRVGVELMFSAPHDAVIGYDAKAGESVLPIEDAGRGHGQHLNKAMVQDVLRGIADFSRAFLKVRRDLDYWPSAIDIASPILDFVQAPVSNWNMLDEVRNFDAWGSSRNFALTMKTYQDKGAI